MNIWEAVGTGFDGGFVPRNRGATTKSSVGWVDVDDDELGSGWLNLSDHEKETRREEIRKWRVRRCWEALEALGPASWVPPLKSLRSSLQRQPSPHSHLSISLSSLLVNSVSCYSYVLGRLPLVLLDEAWSGMDERMIAAARRYLRDCIEEDQAVVVITHWEDEVLWVGEEVKKLKLD